MQVYLTNLKARNIQLEKFTSPCSLFVYKRNPEWPRDKGPFSLVCFKSEPAPVGQSSPLIIWKVLTSAQG